MITQDEKQRIFEAAQAVMFDWYGEKLAQQGACLYWNQVAMRELAMRGHNPLLQAGDMHWCMVATQYDDGEQPTHFGYEFDLTQPFSKDALAKGLFPECHVWCALPKENCLIDFSTGYLAQVAKEQHGYDWQAPMPPEYVFGAPPSGAIYHPKVSAIRFVWRFIAEKLCGEEGQKIINRAFAPAYV